MGDGSRLKLALNNWLAVLVEGMAETLVLSRALGLDPHLFLDAIGGGPLASAYAISKANAMLDGDFVPGFPLRHAVKDAALANDRLGRPDAVDPAELQRLAESLARMVLDGALPLT